MSESPRNAAQLPRMRSSCDGCGAAKLKCDRKHPECGRCVAHGVPCIYGLSRKIGKPPRDRIKTSGTTSFGRITANHETLPSANGSLMSYPWDTADDNNNDNTNSTDNGEDGGVSSNSSNSTNANGDGVVFGLDELSDNSFGALTGSSMSAFTSLDFGEWTINGHHFDIGASSDFLQMPSIEVAAKPNLPHNPTRPRTLSHQAPSDSRSGSISTATRDHDCHKKAHKLMEYLLFANSAQSSPATTQSVAAVVAIGSGRTDRIALDDLLLLNRKSSEQLFSLLACPCASSPQLMMLYASIISTILKRYQEAAADTANASRNTLIPQDTVDIDDGEGRTTPAGQSVTPAPVPSGISIGAFSVEDHSVQFALTIQLLTGEMRRITRLIGQFAACHSNNQYLGERSGNNNLDELNQNLSAWLRGEHSRISDMMKRLLEDLNT
ncbi:hypothetical protein F4801DRAFT_242283 [Xylaria longipes]|nr:hypothetical protein F4801DRAFT_242283 [Xylaria longipes]RYC61647.1 hypothetical protein CHU98_g4557 [Xylaria longipes]